MNSNEKKKIYGQVSAQNIDTNIQNEYTQKATVFDKGTISTISFGGQTFDIFNPNTMNKIMTELSTYHQNMQQIANKCSSMSNDNYSMRQDINTLRTEINSLKTEINSLKEFIKRVG